MPRNSNNPFSTVRTAGLLLPIDLLTRVAARDKTLPGIAPTDYHLRSTETLTEAAGRAWAESKAAWTSYREKFAQLPASDAATTTTRNEWLLPLFQQLGYGRLQTKNRITIDDREYPVSHGWEKHVPIHLLSARYPLDKKTKNVDGAAARSPYSMLQELLNRSPDRRWGFVSNGLKLYVLRDNVSLSRAANVEFDLEAMMEGEVYHDFVLLWLLCHQSRVEILPDPKKKEGETDKVDPQNCWLERWSKEAETRGTRALESLRGGVEAAINALGAGFLNTPGNTRLQADLSSGTLDKQDYYRQLLRLVYRLLLLLVAEEKRDEHDHNLLHPPGTPDSVRRRYRQFYSVTRLRNLAEKQRGSMHVDLYESLKVVFGHLQNGYEPLGIPGFGSFLFNADTSTPDLDDATIANTDFLDALRKLCFTDDSTGRGGSIRRPVDFGNLGSEELGSIYESLLELHPVINSDDGPFKLLTAAGSERKTTGSYYTPRSLINCLLDSALDPVVHAVIDQADPQAAEAALLDLKICDPACGSGHFLIAAAERMAMRLASLRTGDDQPSTLQVQTAKRDIIGRCIYGVDINPMSVELCKVSLWMEALEPGRPLSFLDHHIQCGNSLLGTTPALLANGIPDDAFKPIEGDVKSHASDLKKRNKGERKDREKGQNRLDFEPYYKLGNLPASFARLSTSGDESLTSIAEKERLYASLVSGADYQNARLLADTWCAVFVWKKDITDLGKLCPTENDFRRIENNPHSILPHVRSEVRRLADQYQFFHWHLAFPDVFVLPEEAGKAENEQTGWSRGFDVVLGNPPWEQVEFKEKEWFAPRRPDIAKARPASRRKSMIAQLEQEDEELFAQFTHDRQLPLRTSAFLASSERYPLCGRGRINRYSVFTETKFSLISMTGRVGTIVPAGIVSDETTSIFFAEIVNSGALVAFFGFENEARIFPGVNNTTKFCILVLAAPRDEDKFDFVFFARHPSDITDVGRKFVLSREDIARLNPNTRTCPVFRSANDAEIAKLVYRRVPTLHDKTSQNPDSWQLLLRQGLFSMAGDSEKFQSESQLLSEGARQRAGDFCLNDNHFVPLYEAKMAHVLDHRFGTYEGQTQAQANKGFLPQLSSEEHADASARSKPNYWISADDVRDASPDGWDRTWYLAYRAIARCVDERTFITYVGPHAGYGNSSILFFPNATPELCACLAANLSTHCFDYNARQKIGGSNVSHFLTEQMPVIPPSRYSSCLLPETGSLQSWVLPLVLELTYTAWDLEAFALDCGYDGPPFRWDEERRFLLRCELDAAYFHLYLGAAEAWGRSGGSGQESVASGQESGASDTNPDSSTDHRPPTTDNSLLEMFPTPRDAVDYIMETFPIVKRKDIARTEIKNDSGEITTPGTYITKDTILEIYDAMAESITTGQPYETYLDPPPGPPTDDGNFTAMNDWNFVEWPEHIHATRDDTQLVTVFRKPAQWGLRGDPFLWREMHQHFLEQEPPATSEDFVTQLETLFGELTGARLQSEDSIFVERYNEGGMSSGHVDPTWWRQSGVPLLTQRFTEWQGSNE